ncbi:MAG: GNAT family N-acetyltransferase [Candidatus Sericytochromatia bacterium]|nr:GNAT family N-acetyltransferase [Candidatus Sericytochromatia bacterium]
MIYFKLDDNIELKSLEKYDADALFQLTEQNRTYLRQWLPWLDNVKTVDDTLDFINGTIEKYNGNKAFDLGIWYKNQLAGTIGLHEIKWETEETAIGYWIGQSFQGYGLITKACKFVIDYTFKEFNLKKIIIRCGEHNNKSRSIPIRLGLKEVECLEKAELLYDRYVNLIVYQITHQEYKNSEIFKI